MLKRTCLLTKWGLSEGPQESLPFCLPPSQTPLVLKKISIHILAILAPAKLCFPRVLVLKNLYPKFLPSNATSQNKTRTKNQLWKSQLHYQTLSWSTGLTMGHSGKSENLDLSITPLNLLCGKPDLLMWPDHLSRIWETIIGPLVIRLFSWVYVFS